MNHSTLNENLNSLLVKLHKLGQEMPQILLYLSQIAQPSLPTNLVIPVIGQMFDTIPTFLSKVSPQKLQEIIKEPPAEAVPLRLLLDLRLVQQILQQITIVQLLHLTNNTLPPGTKGNKEAFLKKVQEAFQSWTRENLKNLHDVLSDTPLHLERQQLLEHEPKLPWEILHLLIELLKLPLDELFSFQSWISELPERHMQILIYLLEIEPATLLAIKRRIASSEIALSSSASRLPATTSAPSLTNSDQQLVNSAFKKRKAEDNIDDLIQEELDRIGSGGFSMEMEESSALGDVDLGFAESEAMTMAIEPTNPPPGSPTPTAYVSPMQLYAFNPVTGSPTNSGSVVSAPIAATQPGAGSSSSASSRQNFRIRIVRQPPPKTVYQRILKPFPSVMLESGTDSDSNLFVEAELLRCDTDIELPQCLDGNKIVRISNGMFATFKKLKIMSTSQQQGTLYRLRFTLKRYAGTSFEAVTGTSIISNPVEVFSHTQYIEKQDAPPPPVVAEVLPDSGPCLGGTRIVILGSNFVNNPKLKVRFGDLVVPATFHEPGTLIVTTPPRQRGQVLVTVTNDGVNFCESQSQFSFE